MSLPRRIAVGLAIAALAAASLVALAALPAGAQDAPKGRKVATLKIITPSASVQREGKTEFQPATDGQKLRAGDTVQTDETGFVEIQYADDSFTRLDVNTTFVIESLTDEEGNRKIKGTVESGQTWNRVEALTENESFEQEGAGATAAVTGTAFAVQCDGGACVLTTVVDGVTYTTIDGELKVLDPLLQCTATEVDETNSDLCAVPTELTQAALIANAWLMQNLYLDGLLGYEGPIFGVIVVQDGEVTSFTPTEAPASSTPPVVEVPDPSVTITDNGENGYQDTGPQDEIITDESNNVFFTINTGGATWIIFTDLFEDDPNDLFELGAGVAADGTDLSASSGYCEPSFGTLYWWDGDSWEEVVVDTEQYANDTEFMFEPGEVEPPWIGDLQAFDAPFSQTGEFTFYVTNDGGPASEPETVEVTVYDNEESYSTAESGSVEPAASEPAPTDAPNPEPVPAG